MNILEQITAVKRGEVEKLRPHAGKIKQIAAGRKDFRDFAGALRGAMRASRPTEELVGRAAPSPPRVALIAEVKKASPSAGVIQQNFDALNIALEYERAGASALSVLTDEKFFQGRVEYLHMIREEVKLPLLRKDFIIDELQIYESVARGADAILLIVAILDAVQLKEFAAMAKQLRIASLVEVHHELELDRALAAGAELIGINNRDLRDFSVNLATTERLAKAITAHAGKKRPVVVAESGINTRADVERVASAGVDAILVAESLMRSGNIAAKVGELLGR